jgi:hypothetical protein
MKYVAYKVAKNDPNFPDGFITEHFGTDQEVVEGYSVVLLELFNIMYQNNVSLIRSSEIAKGIVTVDPSTPLPELRPAHEAEHLPSDFAEAPPANTPNNAELFNQFLAWVAAGKPGAPPNT